MLTNVTRVAVITGCGKRNGIGSEIARQLAAVGHTVVPCDIASTGVQNRDDRVEDIDQTWLGLESLVSEITEAGGSAWPLVGDVSDESDVARMVDEVARKYGRLDVLVNNAAAPQGPDYGDIAEVPISAFDLTMRINVRGTFLMSRAAVPLMRRSGWGRIVNISSIHGKIGKPRVVAYAASKAAVLGLTRSLAMDVAASGITVNAICPMSINTSRLLADIRRQGVQDVQAAIARKAAMVPVGRNGEPGDIAAMTKFLVSDEASFVTGQAINVDGGFLPI